MAITKTELMQKPLTMLLAPKEMKEVILLPRISKLFADGIVHDNVLFYGPPGIGKSSLAKLLSKNGTYLYVNASLDGSIDTLRNQITEFAMENTISFTGTSAKILFLDELDGASANFFDAFRGVTEMYPNMRIVATANKFYKLEKYDFITSRFECIPFAPQDSEEDIWLRTKFKNKLLGVSKSLGLVYENDEVVNYIIKRTFPDFRGIYKFIQRMFKSLEKGQMITAGMVAGQIYEFIELYKMILNPDTAPEKFHEHLVINYSDRCQDVIESLDNGFVTYLMENAPQYNNIIGSIVIWNADHQQKLAVCMDQTTVMKSLAFMINSEIKKQNIKS